MNPHSKIASAFKAAANASTRAIQAKIGKGWKVSKPKVKCSGAGTDFFDCEMWVKADEVAGSRVTYFRLDLSTVADEYSLEARQVGDPNPPTGFDRADLDTGFLEAPQLLQALKNTNKLWGWVKPAKGASAMKISSHLERQAVKVNESMKPINRVVKRLFTGVGKDLTKKVGFASEPHYYKADDKLFAAIKVHLSWWVEGSGNKVQWRVEYDIGYSQHTDKQYHYRITAYKNRRSVWHQYVDDTTLDAIKKPATWMPNGLVRGLKQALSGEYTEEINQIKEYQAKMVSGAKQTATTVDQFSKRLTAAMSNREAKKELLGLYKVAQDAHHQIASAANDAEIYARYIRDMIDTITRGK